MSDPVKVGDLRAFLGGACAGRELHGGAFLSAALAAEQGRVHTGFAFRAMAAAAPSRGAKCLSDDGIAHSGRGRKPCALPRRPAAGIF